jgi:bacteriocin biosynthesis cyclodehydratase domain-containing protein
MTIDLQVAPPRDARDAFEATARVYDVLTAHHDYEKWTVLIEGLARPHGLADRGRLLDVGCGTGKSLLPWLARGWSATGCDLSPAMLACARPKLPPEVELLVADARRLPELGPFELVLLLDDVVNYIDAADHAELFAGVTRVLAPDGLAIFDLNTLDTFRTFFAEDDVREDDGVMVVWRGLGNPEHAPGESADATLDAFVRDDDGVWQRSHALHREHHHPLDRVEATLESAGLELVAAYGQDQDCNVDPVPDELRHSKVIVIARRSGAAGGRGDAPARYELRTTVEAFPAGDGSIYFLRGGPDAELVLPEPSEDERALLELLHEPRTAEELRAAAPGGGADAILAELRELGLVRTETGGPSPLPGEAAERYGRQLLYFAAQTGDDDDAVAAQRRLLDATVCIVGCGGLGSWTAAALACAGIGRLVLVDDDSVELSNLNRQLLFRRADVGRPKVEVAAEALVAFEPGLDVVAVPRRVAGAADVRAVAEGSDLVVATADSPPYAITRWIGDAAHALGVPHIGAAQFPPHVRVGPLFVPGVTGCERCQELAARREYPEYDALVAYRRRHDRAAATSGPLSGLVGTILATEAMHLLSGVSTPATQGAAILVDTRDMTVRTEPLAREPSCEACGAGAV